jgi:hypothetical protein
MDKTHAIDRLIVAAQRPAYIGEYTTASMDEINVAEAELDRIRNQVLDSIKVFCDCGKGDACPLVQGGTDAT